MAGVWYFRDGVTTLIPNPNAERGERKVLVYRPTNEAIRSYADLQRRLLGLGWRRYPHEQPGTIQFDRGPSSNHLITLPSDFRRFRLMHMLDIVVNNRDHFLVRDL